MISNSNELSQASLDSVLDNFDDPETGFELDKLEIPKPTVNDEAIPVSGPTTNINSQAKPESGTLPETELLQETNPTSRPIKNTKLLYLCVILGGLILFVCIMGFISIKLLKPNTTSTPKETAKVGIYQPIEPIVTNISDNRYVHIALMLRSHSEKNTQFMTLQSKVIDTVFSFLGSADFKQQVTHGGSAKMKSVLYSELTNLLEKKYPNQAILTEVRLQ